MDSDLAAMEVEH